VLLLGGDRRVNHATSNLQLHCGKYKDAIEDLDETFRDDLRDLEFAAGYLEAALKENLPAFLIALRDVVKAQGDAKAASETELGRVLYKALSESTEIRSFRRCMRSKVRRTSLSVSVEIEIGRSVSYCWLLQVGPRRRKKVV